MQQFTNLPGANFFKKLSWYSRNSSLEQKICQVFEVFFPSATTARRKKNAAKQLSQVHISIMYCKKSKMKVDFVCGRSIEGAGGLPMKIIHQTACTTAWYGQSSSNNLTPLLGAGKKSISILMLKV